MTPPVETLSAAPDMVPSLAGAALRVCLAVALLVGAAWAWIAWRKKSGGGRELQVLDRAFLTRGASVALVRVDDRRLLLGVSGEGVRLLRSLDTNRAMVPDCDFERTLDSVVNDEDGAR